MMIAAVGGDGAGKSYVVRLLLNELRRDFRVKIIDKWDVLNSTTYPEYRFMSPDLPTLRRCVSDMPETTRTLFLFWTLHGTLTPKAAAGADVILLDGYWPKHAASEIRYSGQRELIQNLTELLPRPDLTLFLDVDPAVAYSRRIADRATPLVPYECGLDPSCSKTSFILHQQAIRTTMSQWCTNLDWARIDANADRAAVLEAALATTRRTVIKRNYGKVS